MKISQEKRELLMRDHHLRMLWSRFGLIFLGLWLLTTPTTFGYKEEILRMSDWISGLLLILVGLVSISYRYAGWIYGGAIIGIWLQFAPLVFWAPESTFYINDTFIGIVILALCLFIPMRPKELDRGPMIPPGWSYNPSSWQQRIVVIFLVLIAWFLARYMASFQLHYIHSIVDPFFGIGTEKVITSIISQDFPVADAGLGALAYSLEAIMVVKGGVRRWHTMPWIVLSFGILVIPVGLVSILLIMMQPLVVGAWCGICLLIAASMLLILAFGVDEVIAVLQYLGRVKREKKPFWRTFFMGSEYSEEDEEDKRTPLFSDSASENIRSMFWGITLPPNLVLSFLLGVFLLFFSNIFTLPLLVSNGLDVLGALVIVFSVISWAEVLRSLRFVNIGLAILVALTPFIKPQELHWNSLLTTFLVAVAIIICSLFKGKIKERYGEWDKKIR